MNLVERLKKDKKGFTLIEMIVVIVILGILLAILVPGMIKYIDKAKDKQIMVNAHAAYMDATTGTVSGVTYDKDKGITAMTYTDDASKKTVKIEGGEWKEVE